MTAENEKNSSFSETTRKVFLTTSVNNSPSALFSPPFLTVKGLYPPPSIQHFITRYLVRSLSVPVKLITEKEMSHRPNLMKVSQSAPTFKKPTLIDKLITNMNPKRRVTTTRSNSTSTCSNSSSNSISSSSISSSISTSTSTSSSSISTVRKAPRSSTSTRTASAAPVQIKTSTSIKLVHKLKETQLMEEEGEEEDIPVTKPISLTEKRKRQAKRADQVKIWKVREEREAREARSLIRRKIMSGVTNKKPQPIVVMDLAKKKKKKRVKFDFDKNKIIQIPNE
ncbi:hypothetical protein INT47_010912 [Mucor saturninus]|uniref:Uncharacterized protein n=1 Tax=Mucor saturninus TaxID=64648 RepID=A0A8H7RDX8_9FUNG|nr:hypothetical protein INT47_010912 [Mucor saturninus]